MLDQDVLALAVETGRILVTRDRDFGELTFLRQLPTPPAIIYIRLRHVQLDAYGILLAGFLEREADRVFGNFVALTADGERWRSLTAP